MPLSSADPTVLAHSKKELKSEDDVLHLTNSELPSFNGRVSPMEAEYLLQVRPPTPPHAGPVGTCSALTPGPRARAGRRCAAAQLPRGVGVDVR